MTELSHDERLILARENAADAYDRDWPMRTTMGNLAREGFVAGWDAAIEYMNTKLAEGVDHLDKPA